MEGINQKKRIYLSPPHMGGSESQFVSEAFNENWIAPLGPNVDGFEKDIENYADIKSCAVVNSGTAAIHLALILLGVKKGDSVLCSNFTFSASANPIIYQGARPIFIDSEQETWNIDPGLLEEAIIDQIKLGKKPKALILVHLYGMPALLPDIIGIANYYQIPIVEDAAEALGSEYEGKKLGTFGALGIYSFNGNKIITTSGGGALISDNQKWIEKSKFLASQAKDAAPHYQHSHLGYNYRLSNIAAGIGRGQMKVLDRWVEKRRKNYLYYKNELRNYPLSFLEEPSNSYFSNRWLTTIITENYNQREELRKKLSMNNIDSRPLWKPMHLQPYYKDATCYTNGCSSELFENGLCLPSGSSLTEEEMADIVDCIKQKFKNG